MIHPETQIVTPQHGPRPAGSEHECFYCQARLGQPHKADCVMRMRTVLVRWTVEYVVAVPESWDQGAIEFHRTEGSRCQSNNVGELQDILDNPNIVGCLCYGESRTQFVREATDYDEERYGFNRDLTLPSPKEKP